MLESQNTNKPSEPTSLFRLWPFLLKAMFASQLDILRAVFTNRYFCSTAAEEPFPTLEFAPQPEAGALPSVPSTSSGTA